MPKCHRVWCFLDTKTGLQSVSIGCNEGIIDTNNNLKVCIILGNRKVLNDIRKKTSSIIREQMPDHSRVISCVIIKQG